MRVDDAVRKCVCFIGYTKDGVRRVGGTAFFVAFDGDFRLIVTAQHVINGIRAAAPDGSVVLFVNHKTLGIREVHTSPDDWLTHPTEPSVDAVVCRQVAPVGEWDHTAIPLQMFIGDEFVRRFDLGVGDELYFPGLFIPHHGRKLLRPIVRQGTIAAMPEEPVSTRMGLIDAYLAEVRSIGGLSGSPVFVYKDLWRVPVNLPESELEAYTNEMPAESFLGLVHGHFDAKGLLSEPLDIEAVNMGVSIIVPSQLIREVIEQPEIQNMRTPEKQPAVMDNGSAVADFQAAELDPSVDIEGLDETADLLGKLFQVSKSEAEEAHRNHQP